MLSVVAGIDDRYRRGALPYSEILSLRRASSKRASAKVFHDHITPPKGRNNVRVVPPNVVEIALIPGHLLRLTDPEQSVSKAK